MAINYCTLSGYTLDTFCGNIRQKVLDRLIDEKYPDIPVPPHGGGGGAGTRPGWSFPYHTPFQPPTEREEDDLQLPLEQPFVTVSAQLLGASGAQTLEMKQQLDFVVVVGLKVDDADLPPVVAVNITDFNIS